MAQQNTIQALLSDIGGVVIDIDFERALSHWASLSHLSIDDMRERFRVDEPFKRHETGAMEAAQYFDHLRGMFALDGSDDDIAAGWNAILVDEIPASLALFERARSRLPCYAFSNTSRTHYATWSKNFPRVINTFERLYLSFELGRRKPDRSAFEAVARQIGKPPRSILFFDDLQENVEGARAAGMQAIQVSDPVADIRQALQDLAAL